MNYNIALILLSTILISCSTTNKISDNNTTPKLFQENVQTYNTTGLSKWRWDNGEIVGIASDDSQGILITKTAYDNFKLQLEFFPDSTINSGVFVRCKNYELSATDCHEINIWDLHPNQTYRTGAIVTKQSPITKIETLNHWNTYTIECSGPRIRVWINDTLTADYSDDNRVTGYIGLQANGVGKIRFKNIHLQQL